MTTTTTNNTTSRIAQILTPGTLHQIIDTLAKTATNTALRTIESKTASVEIRELMASLQHDIVMINNTAFTNYALSDAYDLYQIAYAYLYQQIVTFGHTTSTVIGQKQYKGKIKDVTVFTTACKQVNTYINAQKNKYSTTTIHTTYIEDMAHNDQGELLDISLIKVTKYYDVDNYTDYQDLTTTTKAITDKLNPYQQQILKYRLQGLSVSKIADKFNVSQQAISKQLAKIQAITSGLYPEKVIGFKAQRNHK